jgi:Amidohydrolase
MDKNDLILISVDDHLIEPPDMFEGRLPSALQARAPRIVRRDDGTDVWTFEDEVIPNIGLNAVAGRSPEQYGFNPTSFEDMRPGCYDVDERIRDMNANGMWGSMCFPSFPQFCGQLFSRVADKTLGLAVIQAYNDWTVEVWCGTHPGRFIPLGLLPLWDPELAATEVRRLEGMGVHAVAFSANPTKIGYPSIHHGYWDPLFETCSELDTVICTHLGSSSELVLTSTDAPVDVTFTLNAMHLSHAAADLIWSPVLRKFPKLRWALSEGGIGWIPYFLEKCDYVYKHHHAWTNQDFGDRLPSEVFREHVITCFIDDNAGILLRDKIGVNMICWENDYPHSDGVWPNAPERVIEYLGQLPNEEIDMITHLNAIDHFQFDPFVETKRADATVGVLRARAEDVDVTFTPRSTEKEYDGLVEMSEIVDAFQELGGLRTRQ